ncbi:MAG: NUDIX domain-containing protein [Oscillospiraceae bacterium]|nr:NUDIX domain-containing protein [Oscillospiraceae bacterium]
MVTCTLNDISFPMRDKFDFSFVSRWGKVFKVFPDQDSGNICFGTEKDGERFFLKFAGAPTVRYEGNTADAVAALKKAAGNYIALRHPLLIELLEELEIGGGYLIVFRWTDGVCMGKQYPESRAKFFTLPIEKRQKVFVDILDFLAMTAERGYTPVDFYDGSILYDFEQEKTVICDIDFFEKTPFVNSMGRMWGSARFMAPEEFILGAPIDEATNVFLAGAVAFALFGGELDRSREKWALHDDAYAVALKAVSEKREDCYQSLAQFRAAWKAAMCKCRVIAPVGGLDDYRFTVIFAKYKDKWVFPRHRKRQTFETAGGHIEPGETPLDCAKRELWEETGAKEFTIRPVFDYWAADEIGDSNGAVFYAEIAEFGDLPADSEMREVGLFDDLPEDLTYPYITPVLFKALTEGEK